MKKTLQITVALLVCGAVVCANAGQLSTTWTLRNVVDPPDLRDGLNADAQAADLRIDALEASLGTNVTTAAVTVGSLTTTGTVSIADGALTDGSVLAADLDNTVAYTFGSVTTTGTVSLAAGALTDKAVVAADLADAVQDMLVHSFSAVAVPGTQGITNVVTVTAKDIGGNTLATRGAFRCWIADTLFGAVAAVTTSFEVSTGLELEQITDKGDYVVVTDANGVAVLNVQDTVGQTNYLHVMHGGGTVTATTLLWDTP